MERKEWGTIDYEMRVDQVAGSRGTTNIGAEIHWSWVAVKEFL